jgi:hypothetical protein
MGIQLYTGKETTMELLGVELWRPDMPIDGSISDHRDCGEDLHVDNIRIHIE